MWNFALDGNGNQSFRVRAAAQLAVGELLPSTTTGLTLSTKNTILWLRPRRPSFQKIGAVHLGRELLSRSAAVTAGPCVLARTRLVESLQANGFAIR